MARYSIHEYGPKPTPLLAQFEGYDVGQWCPTPDGTGSPEAVILSIEAPTAHFHVNGQRASSIGLRLKSRSAVNVLIEILERHRDEIWPLC